MGDRNEYHRLCFNWCLVLSVWHDKRHVRNPILLVPALGASYISITDYAYAVGMDRMHQLLLLMLFGFLPIMTFLSGFFLIYNGILLLKKEGKSKANYLSLGMGIAIILVFFLPFLRLLAQGVDNVSTLINMAIIFIFFSFLVCDGLFVGFLLYSVLYNFMPKRKDYDFIIIHRAGLIGGEVVTPLLKKWIDKTVEAFRLAEKPTVKLIASGGQGSDEKISEAQAIANYLQSIDFPMDKVLLEDRSTTTYENLVYSKELALQTVENPRFLFVTNDYHIFRTSLYARKAKLKGNGLGCQTASYYIPSAFIREYIAFLTKIKWFLILIFTPFLILLLIYFSSFFFS